MVEVCFLDGSREQIKTKDGKGGFLFRSDTGCFHAETDYGFAVFPKEFVKIIYVIDET